MEKLVERITDKLVSSETVLPEDRDIYEFGLQQGFWAIVNYITIVIVALLLNMFWEAIVFSSAYLSLRSFAGGYHTKTPLRCYVVGILIVIAALAVIKYVPWNMYIIMVSTVVSAIIVCLLAPIEDANKPLDKLEEKRYRKRTLIILLIQVLIILFSLVFNVKVLCICIVVALVNLSVILIVGKIKNQFNKEKNVV